LIAISLLSLGIGMWMVTSMEFWAFDEKKTMERPSFYSSFWSLISDFHDTGIEIFLSNIHTNF